MRILTRLEPFEGERVIGLSPKPAAEVADWNRRLNLFTGRALTSQALTGEQQGTLGRFALRGQMVSAGIIAGLEIALDQSKSSLLLAPGFGVSASGEDVVLPLPLSVRLRDISVCAPTGLLKGEGAPAPGALVARNIGDSLDAIIAKGLPLPKAGMLLLEPVVAEVAPDFQPADPCEQDPQNDAFNDAQFVDGFRLIYYAWPAEWLPLPPVNARWRNALAHAIFEREAQAQVGELLPWEQFGLPLGVIAFDGQWSALFVDRHAVARNGGKAKRRTSLIANSGNQFLWQARIQQFVQHVIDLDPSQTALADLGRRFRYLPPAGVLPKNALTFGDGPDSRVLETPFFPAGWTVNVVPAPQEQLDLAIEASAPLAALDAFWPETVHVLVPVPQIWYEPDLLRIMRVAPEFQQAVDQFSHLRSIWLKRRMDVRAALSTLVNAISDVPVSFPSPDPDAVEVEDVAANEIDPKIDAFKDPELPYGVTGNLVDRIETLKKDLMAIPGVALEPDIPTLGIPGVGGKPEMTLVTLISDLQAKLNDANDNIDFGFLHAQTDIYRARQNMLGNDAGTRLATSPALAMIAQGVSAAATKDDLVNLITKLRGPRSTPLASTLAAPASLAKTESQLAIKSSSSSIFVAANTSFLARGGGVNFELPPTAGAVTRAAATAGAPSLFGGGKTTNVDVRQQRPIIGAGYDLRSTSVVERLKDPPATEAKQFTVSSKYSVLSNFINLAKAPKGGINIGDISVPGFLVLDGNGNLPTDPNTHLPVVTETRKNFRDITDQDLGHILNGHHDPITSQDEAGFFQASVRAMEHTIEILRLLEGRVQAYQNALDLCRLAMADIQDLSVQADGRLKAIGDELGKARHDVAFAKALLAEETERVKGINDRRDQIVAQQVKFVAFIRPRTTEAITTMQVRSLDPGFTEQVVPTCLARNIAAPPELRAMANLLREAPLRWFVHIPVLLDFFDRLDVLHGAIRNSKLRAGFKTFQAPEPDLETGPGPFGPHILNLYSGRRRKIDSYRLSVANLDMAEFAGRTWEQSRLRAVDIISLGDLIDHGHYHPNVPRVSAEEIENLLKVSACLYSDFAAVLPAIRLNWAERLAQLDGHLNLANLASLPRWAEVPFLERKEMQSIVDWLFSRVVATEPDAVAHINDLVRVCLLLASHASVTEIIAGSVIRPTPIMVNTRIDLAADLSRVRIGMHVLVYSGEKTVARGVVENLSSGQATARILTTASKGLTLDTNSKVHFAAPDAFERNPFTAGRLL
jgi:hypothetical protein